MLYIKLIVATIGHIAAGKTTTLRAIHSKLTSVYVSEGGIKRSFVSEYNYENSLDEDLRNRGYREAIRQAVEAIRTNDVVLLDASFHRGFRREWLFDELRKYNLQNEVMVVWVFCFCCNESEVYKRIKERAEAKVKTADNQADHISVLNHILRTFDFISEESFPSDFQTKFIVYTPSLD